MIRLVVVDDHPPILDAFRARASESADIELVAVATDATTAASLISRCDPDVVVCDIQLGDGATGLDLLRGARGHRPAFLMLTAFDVPSLIRAALEAGAAGYLLKSATTDDVLMAVRTIADGGTVFPAATMRAIRTAPRRPSAREVDVLRLVAEGATNGEVALRLGLSEKTVESHLRRLFDRYAVMSRTELALFAVREGWLALPGRSS